MKRLLSLLLVFCFALTLLVGCSDDGNSASNGDNHTTVDDGIFSTADVKFLDSNNESVYRITRPEKDTINATQNAANVFKQMKETLGVSVKNLSDSDDGTDTYEIHEWDNENYQEAMAFIAQLNT
jgi:hypothetical protein